MLCRGPVLNGSWHSLERTKNQILQGGPRHGGDLAGYDWVGFWRGTVHQQIQQAPQFHPSSRPRGFVRGFRPIVERCRRRRPEAVDGPLIRLADKAKADQAAKYTMVIEEINRGNPGAPSVKSSR